uniref:Uncharacterized protein n=1 Tax=Anguilla anguilla TaxID=7936 RepID=A0A0E9WWR6_ANGAN
MHKDHLFLRNNYVQNCSIMNAVFETTLRLASLTIHVSTVHWVGS